MFPSTQQRLSRARGVSWHTSVTFVVIVDKASSSRVTLIQQRRIGESSCKVDLEKLWGKVRVLMKGDR